MSLVTIQFLLALPLWLGGIAYIIWGFYHPLRVGILGLSFFSFCFQFFTVMVVSPFSFTYEPYVQVSDIVFAFFIIYSFWATVWLISLLWKSHLNYIEIDQINGFDIGRGVFASLYSESGRLSNVSMVLLYFLILVFRLIVMIKYGVGFSGSFLEKAGNIPYSLLSTWVVLNLLGLSFVFVCTSRLLMGVPSRALNLTVLLVELFFCFINGRRVMLLAFLLILFSVVCRKGKIKIKHIVIGAIIGFLAWQFLFPIFFFMRFQIQAGERNVFNLIKSTIQRAFSEKVAYMENVEGRLLAFNVNYNVAHQINTGGISLLNGKFLKMSVISTIPSVLYPAKLSYIEEPDKILTDTLGLGYMEQDIFSNFGMFASADYGLKGGVIYGIIFIIVIRYFEIILKLLFVRSPIGAISCFSIIARCPMFQMEYTPNDLMMSVRTVLMVFLPFYIWGFFRTGDKLIDSQEFESYN